MCQRWSASVVGACVSFPLNGLAFEAGREPLLYRLCETTQLGFCPVCGSSVFALDDGAPDVTTTLGVFDDPAQFQSEDTSYPESASAWPFI